MATLRISVSVRRHFGLLVLAIGLGCSQDPLGRQAISGSVTVDGSPLERGNISFQPMEGQPTSSGAVVTAGKYSVPRNLGLVPGKYRVSINAPVPGTGGKPDVNSLPGDIPPPPKELVPKEWNVASEKTIEVKKGGPATYPFEVQTKSSTMNGK